MKAIFKLEKELMRRLPNHKRIIADAFDHWAREHLVEVMSRTAATAGDPRAEAYVNRRMATQIGEIAQQYTETWDEESDIGGRAAVIRTMRLTVLKP